jgi:hypothetical protein
MYKIEVLKLTNNLESKGHKLNCCLHSLLNEKLNFSCSLVKTNHKTHIMLSGTYHEVCFMMRFIIQDYYKRNRHFQCCIETKLLMI